MSINIFTKNSSSSHHISNGPPYSTHPPSRKCEQEPRNEDRSRTCTLAAGSSLSALAVPFAFPRSRAAAVLGDGTQLLPAGVGDGSTLHTVSAFVHKPIDKSLVFAQPSVRVVRKPSVTNGVTLSPAEDAEAGYHGVAAAIADTGLNFVDTSAKLAKEGRIFSAAVLRSIFITVCVVRSAKLIETMFQRCGCDMDWCVADRLHDDVLHVISARCVLPVEWSFTRQIRRRAVGQPAHRPKKSTFQTRRVESHCHGEGCRNAQLRNDQPQ